MKTVRILQNQNKIYSETTTDAFYPNQAGDFSMRLVFNGSENCNVAGRNLNIYPFSFLILNEGTGYSTRIYSNTPVHTFSVFFARNFLLDFHSSFQSSDTDLLDNPFAIKQDESPRFLETLYPLNGDLKFNFLHLKKHFDGRLDNEMLLNEYLYHCLFLYYQIYNKEVISKSNNLGLNKQTKIEVLRRLAVAKDYIFSNFNRPLSLEEISRQACLSVNHLLRTFKQAFNCSPHQYLIKVRLTQAKFLLKTTSYSVTEVVDMVGFECPSSFIRLFKSNYKITPGSFRNHKTLSSAHQRN